MVTIYFTSEENQVQKSTMNCPKGPSKLMVQPNPQSANTVLFSITQNCFHIKYNLVLCPWCPNPLIQSCEIYKMLRLKSYRNLKNNYKYFFMNQKWRSASKIQINCLSLISTHCLLRTRQPFRQQRKDEKRGSWLTLPVIGSWMLGWLRLLQDYTNERRARQLFFHFSQVGLSFSPAQSLPASHVHLRVTASPQSLCALRAVDLSVLLMRPEAELSPTSVSPSASGVRKDHIRCSELGEAPVESKM